MKTVEKLILHGLKFGESKKLGNHRVEVNKKTNTIKFYYYDTAIVTMQTDTKIIVLDDGGYNTSSTNRAINAYVKDLKNLYPFFDIIDRRDK